MAHSRAKPHRIFTMSLVTRTVTPLPNPQKRAVALLLTFVAGSVDVIGYLTIQHVFTAHVSGLTAHLGIDLIGHDWSKAAIGASVIAAFLVGSILGRVIIEVAAQARFRRIASVALGIEMMLLLVFAVGGRLHPAGNSASSSATAMCLLSALGCAMGLQTATLTRIGSLTVHTTFVTGMINKLAQQCSHFAFESYALYQASPDRELHYRALRKNSFSQILFFSGIWILYLTGAVSGTFLDSRIGLSALYLDLVLLACAITADWIQPLAVEEEHDQSER